jgi:excisionase family DNA binding protein
MSIKKEPSVFTEGEEFLTLKETMAYLRSSPTIVYGLLQSGKIRATKVGHRWLIRKKDVDAYLDQFYNTKITRRVV